MKGITNDDKYEQNKKDSGSNRISQLRTENKKNLLDVEQIYTCQSSKQNENPFHKQSGNFSFSLNHNYVDKVTNYKYIFTLSANNTMIY